MATQRQSRSAYTLVELLVVIGLIATLAALTIAFYPSAAGSAREARAATSVQGWLNVAKSRALRDQAPRGLRLWIAPAGTLVADAPFSNVCTECQYLEQPEDFSGGFITSTTVTAPNDTINFALGFGDLANGYVPITIPNSSDPNRALWAVQPGDFLEVHGSGLMHVITQVSSNGLAVMIAPPLPSPIQTPTRNYRIVRAPRPVGDETLKMPLDTMVDFNTNGSFGSALPITYDPVTFLPSSVDIVFAPSGAVITPGVPNGNINLWVRAPQPQDPNNPFFGDPTIVSVYVRTGFVAAYAPAQPQTGLQPYANVQ